MSSFSNHNVTYRCAGVQQSLCPGATVAGGRSVRALLEDQFETLHRHALRLRRPRRLVPEYLSINDDDKNGDIAEEVTSLGRPQDVDEEEDYASGPYQQEGEEYEDDEGDVLGLGLLQLHEASWSYQQTALLLDLDQHIVSTNVTDGESVRAHSVGIYHHGRSRRLKGAPKGGKKGGGVKTARKRTASGSGHDDYVNGTARVVDDGGYPPADDLFKNAQGLGVDEFATFTAYVGQLLGGRKLGRLATA